MSSTENKTKLLISDSLLPDVFLMRYSEDLSKDGILMYLWLNMNFHGNDFTYKQAAALKVFGPTDSDNVLAELVSAGLLIRKGDDFTFVDLKQREIDEYIASVNAKGITLDGTALKEDKERDKLANSIAKTYYQGKMAYIFYRLIDKCLYEYKFEPMVVYQLFTIGSENHIHRSINAMEKKAQEWNDKGYNTTVRLNEYLADDKKVKEATNLMSKLSRRKLNALETERIGKWITELRVSIDLIDKAYRTNEFRGNIKMTDVETTLTKWVAAGITTIDEATRYEEEQHKENKKKAMKKSSKNNGWLRGQEAGLTIEDEKKSTTSEEDEPAFAKPIDSSDDDSDINDVLKLFGDDN